jgi:N6-L-threonylcarbamoyladenine synthase
VIDAVLDGQPTPDAIAVTAGPGLITGLIVGVEAVRNISYLTGIPLIRVNHISGHINSVLIGSGAPSKLPYPHLALIVSGGHTDFIYSTSEGKYKRLGGTLDDAVGECFDKVASLLDLEYPGGPKVSHAAKTGRPNKIKLPRPMIKSGDMKMSFSGLKTAALYWLRDNQIAPLDSTDETPNVNDFCLELELAITDILSTKLNYALDKYKVKAVIFAGGVSANQRLRKCLSDTTVRHKSKPKFFIPEIKYAMDNAAMIAVAAHRDAKNKKFTPWHKLKADPNWEIG